MPFMDEPPGAKLSTNIIGTYGRFIRTMRGITNTTVNKEPKWRHRGRATDHWLSSDNLLSRRS